MKYGIREICDVVLKAKSKQVIGNRVFYKDEPVIYFDSLKTSSMEGAATTVYAQGGRGNSRLIAWEGERTVTFTMEDALISTYGLAILTGAGIIESDKKIRYINATDEVEGAHYTLTLEHELEWYTNKDPRFELFWYNPNTDKVEWAPVPQGENILSGAVISEDHRTITWTLEGFPLEKTEHYGNIGYFVPATDENGLTSAFIAGIRMAVSEGNSLQVHTTEIVPDHKYTVDSSTQEVRITPEKTPSSNANAEIYVMPLINGEITTEPYLGKYDGEHIVVKSRDGYTVNDFKPFEDAQAIMLDYYVDMDSGVQQIEITPDKFGGNYYLEASTLFRDTNGVDMPAEFIIPNCKIQSNFTFTMASSGDPSTFTFTMDAFPDYTRFDKTKKVLSVIQVISDSDDTGLKVRQSTDSSLTES